MEFSDKETEPVFAIPPKSEPLLWLFVSWLRRCSVNFIKSLPVFLGLSVVLIVAAMLFPLFYTTFIGGHFEQKASGTMVLYDLYSAFIYLLIPAFVTRFVFRDSLADLGWRAPVKRGHAVVFTLLALGILVPYILMFTQQSSFRQFYSVHDAGWGKLVFFNLVIFPVYYFVEEFFYRGFLFLYLWKKVGWHSFWITDILFTFSHLGKPGLEILLCIPASVVFNCLTLATRSFFPAFVVHFTLGTVLFLVVNF
jgi:membrane protease YdiL (CAAX protease family)